MKCKKCGEENAMLKRCCSRCGAILEGYTLNNVTGEYGYRGGDGNFYKSEEEYQAAIRENGGENVAFVYVTPYWFKALIFRLVQKPYGINGITVEEFEELRPMVEKLSFEDFVKTPKLDWIIGPTEKDIRGSIETVKMIFADFSMHPEKLAKNIDDITITSTWDSEKGCFFSETITEKNERLRRYGKQ